MPSFERATPARRREALLASVGRLCRRMVRQRYGKQFSSGRALSVERTLQRGVERIWALGYHLDDVKMIDAHHVQALVESLSAMGYAASTVQGYVGVFRQLGRWLSKPELRNFSVK